MKRLSKAIIPTLFALAATSHAAVSVNSSGFNGVTNAAIITTGLADWGYFNNDGNTFDGVYNNVDFGAIGITTVSGSSTIGTVALTENNGSVDAIQAQTNDANFTFDGNATFGSYGGFAPSEQDIWTMTFNDLGVGDHTISLYMGHSSTNRVFDMDVSGTGLTLFTDVSPTISTLGSTVAAYGTTGLSFTYDIDVTVTDAADDLTLTFGGVSGGFGGAILSGYTVATVPEPATTGLLGLAGLAMFIRRRR